MSACFINSRKILWELWRPFLKVIRYVHIRRFILELGRSVYLQWSLSCCWGILTFWRRNYFSNLAHPVYKL